MHGPMSSPPQQTPAPQQVWLPSASAPYGSLPGYHPYQPIPALGTMQMPPHNIPGSAPSSNHLPFSSAQSPPILSLPSTYDGTPGSSSAAPASQTIPPSMYNSYPGQAHPSGAGPYPPHPYGAYGLMANPNAPHGHPGAHPYYPTPLSPVFKNENAGPPVGTTPGTPGVPNAYPTFVPPGPGMPPNFGMPPGAGMYPVGMPPNMYMPHVKVPAVSETPMPQASPNPYPGVSPQQPPLSPHPSIVPQGYGPYDGTDPYSRDRMVHQEVKLEISAKGLRDRDITSKSDPTCVVFLEQRAYSPYGPYSSFYPSGASEEFGTGNGPSPNPGSNINWKEIGRTECIKNCLNPHFKVQITIPYHFEQLQYVRLGLWDIDSKKADLSTHDFLGDVRTTMAELVMAGVWTSPLSSSNIKDLKKTFGVGKRDLGKITVIVHENRDGGNMLIKAALFGRKLDRKDLWITSDPYFIVSQVGKTASSRSQLYKSEVIRRTTNPVWRPFQFKVAVPKGGGKKDIKLEFLVYDKDNHRRDDEIGKAVHSLDELEKTGPVPVINEARQARRRSYKNSGMLEFSKFEIIAMPSLVDYLQGGLKLHFSVAVDLTASNGNPIESRSLHFQDYYGNRYTRALCAIANVLRVYCPSDNKFAAFGFGAELPGNPGYTSSCFPLGLGPDPMCNGIHGILEAYGRALHSVRLSGPTNFAPLIETVSRKAAQRINTQTDQNYDVLLILTDGVVSDFDLTVDRIISASRSAPLSIIIIGIGMRNFRKMKDLDSDDKLLQSTDGTRQAVRDICQFVDFSEYESSPPERLGAAVLAELPGNIVEYFVGICDPPIQPGHRLEHTDHV